ncbi:MAG: hypothetical protein MHPSP_003394, partial [Paramarteilia canceri]
MVKSETEIYNDGVNNIKIPIPGTPCIDDINGDTQNPTLTYVRGIALNRQLSADVYVCANVPDELGFEYRWGYVAIEDIKQEKEGSIRYFTDSLEYLLNDCQGLEDKFLWCDDGYFSLGHQICLKENTEITDECHLTSENELLAQNIIDGGEYSE